MSIKEQEIIDFAEEAKLTPSKIRDLMYPPRVKRNAKVERQIFVPPPYEKAQKPETRSKRQKPKPYEFSIRPETFLAKNFDWNPEISKFFEIFKELKPAQSTDQSKHIESDIRNFLLFQSSLKSYPMVQFCVTFYHLVKKKGGFLQVLGTNSFPSLMTKMEQLFHIEENIYPIEIYFQIYKRHILAFQMFKSGHLKQKQPVDIDQAKYFTSEDVDLILKNKMEEVEFNRDTFVFENFSEYVGFNLDILSTKYFNERYGHMNIDTRIQKGDAMGFDVFTTKMFNEQESMKASDYLRYQELEGTAAVKKLALGKKLKPGQVSFAVNVDLLEKEDIEKEIHSKLNKFKFVQYVNELDALSYCQNWIPGCNHPQLYFKVRGVYTGGHQENVSMASVNVNFGPDDSEWFTLDIEHVPRLRKQVIQEHGIDIIDNEGLWFAPPEWMIVNNYPIKKIIQKKGDLVYSGPGTLHWVRSMGKCFQVAWNVFPKTESQWKQAMARSAINYEINFYQIFMPMKSLAIKILNHQYTKRTPFVEAIERSLAQWLREEANLIKAYNNKNKSQQLRVKYRQLSDIESLCNKCRHQILTIYYLDTEQETVCLKCCLALKSTKRSFFKKHNIEDINQLLHRIKRLREEGEVQKDFEVKGLCCQKYCGVVNCSLKNKTREVEPIGRITKSNKGESHEKITSFSCISESQVIKREINAHMDKVRQKQQVFFNEILVNPQTPKIDPVMLFVMLYRAMPECSWNSTEDVLKAQISIMKEIGYIPTEMAAREVVPSRPVLPKHPMSVCCSGGRAFNTSGSNGEVQGESNLNKLKTRSGSKRKEMDNVPEESDSLDGDLDLPSVKVEIEEENPQSQSKPTPSLQVPDLVSTEHHPTPINNNPNFPYPSPSPNPQTPVPNQPSLLQNPNVATEMIEEREVEPQRIRDQSEE